MRRGRVPGRDAHRPRPGRDVRTVHRRSRGCRAVRDDDGRPPLVPGRRRGPRAVPRGSGRHPTPEPADRHARLARGHPHLVTHPFHDVAIAGVFNTAQARSLDGHDSQSIAVEGALGALADAGIPFDEVDGIAGQFAADLVLGARMGPCSRKLSGHGIPTVLEAASMIAFGECEVVVIAAGGAAMYTERSATAPWTRPANELVMPYGLFTAAEFALMARRHMVQYGTTAAQLALVAATIRNNGHVNPEAVYCGRGPFTPQDIVDSRMVADPF